MSKLLDQFNKEQLKKVPDIKPGDTIRVHQKIKEGDKDRIQIFEGLVIAKKHGKGINSNITVRKVVDGIGVERIFPTSSPAIEKIEVVRSAKVRKSKLYYLRTAKGKKAKLKKKDLAVAIAPESKELESQESEELPAEEVETIKVSEENN
ncbi:MAG: 50S ribosomal protein L19 [Candidatus Staskawiczbacteria bacterium RIFOXYB1_FULL_32_11]|uniref:Large ribosomal subunit protein bL19 n=1 Tax=Candidatus Staskawiczbacteria bacterium RIFOXYD1_FULL_32_13 TaxID=1802234 RepID=A0A1G2JMF6_9BACT|nr:MAG: 50S ribosomal protein L19 [Parcubacteria group bacterium GW2011_GWC2_32_10]OGZ78022.1 MAG: 50S ribosomal protein L19 [Candidatus Staskawiczbacteria bacterium RIFOXYB1_FULL_32_11]OGZ78435.1 MAG: 50S ribosomal protein L19 [Candidatus Staskawiczbacteria bacterium RIFOXYA2_FULL_32_7]OGZ87490.1 MAG: 50S ribosomal protein L19 [Candidatus Staskawiczbacteria bacterium RIFOXYD1_FULL_32_13]OGZ88110.1 MAG: 50S ribosomal protein L19 [Candidatus Staskawiczbacteria bacterium RIFOXYC2_FULL_32_10]